MIYNFLLLKKSIKEGNNMQIELFSVYRASCWHYVAEGEWTHGICWKGQIWGFLGWSQVVQNIDLVYSADTGAIYNSTNAMLC